MHCILLESKNMSRFSSTEHAANFAINRSSGMQLKAFDKSMKTPPTTLLSKCCLHSSKSPINMLRINIGLVLLTVLRY